MIKEEILKQKTKKIFEDFKKEFIEDSFKIYNPNELKEKKYYTFSFDVWEVFVDVSNEQFGGLGVFSIYFKNETMEPFMFHDGGAEGRVPELEIIKKNGKYTIGNEWKKE